MAEQTCKKIELLAPAKDKAVAYAAINAGADAVYMGYQKFGARSAAGNSFDDIKEVVEYAHKFGVKIYITLNTIFKDSEISQVAELINDLYSIDVDAIIIQDMGLLEFDLPPIPLNASTQCHNNTIEKIQFLEKTGFKRVILPRELSLEKIKEIADNTNVEIETFVHGALCVSYSGQCYMSCAIGGRSANRGECAQPCRKKYSLVDSDGKTIAKDKYLLSLKDFNLSKSLKDLLLAGVTSFKIEGRLKDENYVKNVVSFYRKELDNLLPELGLKRASLGASTVDFEPDLYKSFNRGFTTHFLYERTKDISAFNYSKSLGEPIGKVTKVSKDFFMLCENNLVAGDGICFFLNDELSGSMVQKVENGKIYPNSMDGIEKDLFVYRNLDKVFNSKLATSKIERKIPVELKVFEKDNNIHIYISDEENNSFTLSLENTFEKAKNETAAVESIKKQFSKMGDTEFVVSTFNVNIESAVFIPVSVLNAFRRDLIDKFRAVRKNNFIKSKRINDIALVPYPYENLDYSANIYNSKAKSFYQKRGVVELEMAAETKKNLSGLRVMTTKHCLRYSLDMCNKMKNKNNSFKEPFFLVDEKNKKYRLDFDCKTCEMHISF